MNLYALRWSSVWRVKLLVAALSSFCLLQAAPDPAKQADRRAKIAEEILGGTRKAESAVNELKSSQGISGVEAGKDADFSMAAMDVGHRLLVKGDGADALVFFRAAEAALDGLAAKTPDTSAGEKAFYLKSLAVMRGHYLGKAAQAKLDIEQAAKLLPSDEHIKHVKQSLAGEHGDVFKTSDKPTSPKG